MSTRDGQRLTVPLDGQWDFRFGDEGEWRTIAVPGPWQAQFDDLRLSFGLGRYRRRITVPPGSGEALLRFGAVSDIATVRLDGREIGRHEGGYLPFEIALPEGTAGDALLEVDALLPSSDGDLHPDAPFPEIPHGKQSWYGPLGGLWQSVSIERRDARHVAGVAITAELGSGAVAVRLRLSPAAAGCTIRLRALCPDGEVVAEARAVAGDAEAALARAVPGAPPGAPAGP